jgi:hypothetical protein
MKLHSCALRGARSHALATEWQFGVSLCGTMVSVARVVDPKPWYRARRDEQLERLEAMLAPAASDDERAAVARQIAEVRKEYRREVRRSRPIPW